MRVALSLLLFAVIAGGCDFGGPIQLGPPQPALIILQGKVSVPEGYIAPTVKVYSADGKVLAAGTVIAEDGSYNVCIAPKSLTSTASLYQVALKEGDLVVYSAPVLLKQGTQWGKQDINAATTAVWLAAHESRQKGQNPLKWNFERLLQDPTVLEVAEKLEDEVAKWSKEHKSSPLPADIQGRIGNIVAVASKV